MKYTTPIIRPIAAMSLAACMLSIPATAKADVIFDSGDPCGIFGCWGADVFINQSVGLRITPDADYTFDEIRMWFMNNDGSGQHFGKIRLTVETDNGDPKCSTPSGNVLDEMTFTITAIGWNPELETVTSNTNPLLLAGEHYWFVASCDDPPFIDPVWLMAAEGLAYGAYTDQSQTEWQCGHSGAAAAAAVEATPVIWDFSLTTTPLIAGQTATIDVNQSTPSTMTYLAYSLTGTSETYIAPLNINLYLTNPSQALTGKMSDALGHVAWTFTVPGNLADTDVWLQTAQFGSTSNVLHEVVQ